MTYWFKRFRKEAEALSPHIEFRRLSLGFYRIYWVRSGHSAYMGECYVEMPEMGYDIDEKDINLVSQKYYEEFEERTALTRKIKNFVEGYWESIDRLKTNVYLFKNNKEHRQLQIDGYKEFVIK